MKQRASNACVRAFRIARRLHEAVQPSSGDLKRDGLPRNGGQLLRKLWLGRLVGPAPDALCSCLCESFATEGSNEDQGTDLRPQALLLCLGTGPAPRPRRGLTISQSSILSSCHGSLFSLQGEGPGAGRSLKQLLLRRPRTSQALVVAQESCRAVSLGSQTWDTARKTWLRFRSPPLF